MKGHGLAKAPERAAAEANTEANTAAKQAEEVKIGGSTTEKEQESKPARKAQHGSVKTPVQCYRGQDRKQAHVAEDPQRSTGGGGTRRSYWKTYEEIATRRIGQLHRQGLDWTAISNLEHEPRHEPYGDTYYQSLMSTEFGDNRDEEEQDKDKQHTAAQEAKQEAEFQKNKQEAELACCVCNTVKKTMHRLKCSGRPVCWNCAVKQLTPGHTCWQCHATPVYTTTHLEKDAALDLHVKEFQATGRREEQGKEERSAREQRATGTKAGGEEGAQKIEGN